MLVCYADTKSNQGYITEGTDSLCRKYLHGATGVPYGCLRLVHGGSLMNIEVASGVVEFGIGLATGL